MPKKFAKYAAAGAMCLLFAVVGLPGASVAQTSTADLIAQIAALQAQLLQLEAQLNAITGATTVPAACSGITFTRNLSLGSTGSDVRCLQALLNQSADTRVAASGPGSPGSETMYFGPLTQAAVIRFQVKYASTILTPLGLVNGTGFVGAATRAKLNGLLVVVPPVIPPPPTGNTVGGIVINGTEGDITVTANATPPNGVKVYEGDTKDTVMGINVRATGSDVSVQRVTLEFGQRPQNFFDNIYLYSGGTLIANAPMNSSTVTRVTATDYTITLSNFQNNFVVTKDNTKTLNVKVDVLDSISSDILPSNATVNVDMNVAANGIRAIDQANISIFDPSRSNTVVRTINVNNALSTTASLVISRSSGTPASGNLVADNNNQISGATLLKFDIRAQRGNVTIDEIDHVQFTTGAGFLVPQTAYLYDDSGNVLASDTPDNTGLVNFTDLSYDISANTTDSFLIKIDDTLPSNGSENGDRYRVTVSAASGNTAYIVAQRPDGSLLGAGNLAGSATSNDQFAFTSGAMFVMTNVSTTSTPRTEVAAPTISATFTIQVTASNADIFIAKNGAFNVFAVQNNNPPGTLITTTVYSRPSQTTELTNSYQVSQGTTATFVVTSTYVLAGSAGNYDLRVEEIDWGLSDANPAANASTYMADTFISNIVFLQ